MDGLFIYDPPGGGGGAGSGIDISLSGNTSGALALISSGTAILAGGSNITLSQAGQSITIIGTSGGSQSVQTQNLIDLSLAGNTAGALALVSSGTAILAGGNNITLSQNAQSITISGPNTAAQTNQTLGLYAVGNTASTSTSTQLDARTISFNAAGNLSVGYSAGSVVLSAGGAANSIGGNSTSAGAGYSNISTGTVILAGGNNITLSQNGASVTISQNDPVLSYLEPAVRGSNSFVVPTANYLFVQPFFAPNNVSIYRMQLMGSWLTATSTFSVSGFVSSSFASYGVTGQATTKGTALLFSRQSTGTAAASSNIVTFYSNTYSQAQGVSLTFSSGTTNASSATFTYTTSAAISFLSNIDSVGGTTTGSFGTSVASTVSVTTNAQESTTVSIPCAFANSVLSGARPLNIPMNTSLSAGEYWLGIINSIATASTQFSAQNVMSVAMSVLELTAGGVFQSAAVGSTAAFSSSNGVNLLGSFNSASTTNTTTTMALTNISAMSQQLWFNAIAQTL